MFRKILIATDGSYLAECAARAAISIAKGGSGQVIVLSVARPYGASPKGVKTQAEAEAAWRQAHQDAIDCVGRIARFAHEAGVPGRTITAVSSFPGDEIIHAAEQNGCDLIALGAHGERTVPPVLAGGVAQQVLAYSSIPVLMLRAPGQTDHTL